jgi:UDP-N-acetylmuramoyl-tripeptide--D-alanyl-D-alanine ligase
MLGYRLDLLARILDARLRGPGDQVVQRVCTDSRQVGKGDLFVALTGENFDGHQYVADALARGAVGAVVNPERLRGASTGSSAPEPVIEVPDPLLALGSLGAWHRDRFQVRMVAVTGSVGKTTTKDLIAGVLKQQWTTLKSPGNLNAEIGLPLTLLELRPQHQAAVVELAMRGPGQIRYLARIARPDVAVITNIGLSHTELLGSQDAIAAAKAELLDFLPLGGTAVLNADDAYLRFLKERVPPGAHVATFSSGRGSSDSVSGTYLGSGPRPGDRSANGPLGARFTLRAAKGQNVRWSWIPLLGRHNMVNALAAAAVGQALGVSWPRISRGLAEAEISGMRMAIHRLRDGTMVLDDAYNASSPEAMIGALEVLKELSALRKIAVLGNMLELGDASEDAHRKVGAMVARTSPNYLVTVGDKAKLIAESAVDAGFARDNIAACATNEEALEQLRPRRRPGDLILVKGSRGMAMEGIVRELSGDGKL